MKLAIIDKLGLCYDGNTLSKQGLGGSESAVILLSKELAKIGFEVTVFNNCKDGSNSRPGIYDNVRYVDNTDAKQDNIDYDVFVVTKTEIPILIDLGISQHLSQDHPFIVEKVDNKDPDVLGNYVFDNYNIIYQTKRNIRLPSLHQKTFLERIDAEVQASSKIKTITLLVYFVSAFTLFNFIANMAIILF